MRVKKKCSMFWLNPIALNQFMILCCTCSKFKILEKNNVFCIVAALRFNNLIKFYVILRWLFSTFGFSFSPGTLHGVSIPWPFRCVLMSLLVGFIKEFVDRGHPGLQWFGVQSFSKQRNPNSCGASTCHAVGFRPAEMNKLAVCICVGPILVVLMSLIFGDLIGTPAWCLSLAKCSLLSGLSNSP